MSEEVIKLLPCPFCGTKEGSPEGPVFLYDYSILETHDCKVQCYACNTEKRAGTKEDAISGWNNRVKNP